MTKGVFNEFLFLSDKMRKGYINSLGNAIPTWENYLAKITSATPEVISVIYEKVSGTHRDISTQKYLDFVPGYRLIHIEELEREYHILLQRLEFDDVCKARIEMIIPLLADYSSCYICYAKTTDNCEGIFHYSPEDGLLKMHDSVELFFKTIIAFYTQDVFFLDKDGYLDYDFEKEGIIGVAYNPGIDYWIE